MQSIGLSEQTLKTITRIFFKFLWKKRYSNQRAFEKIKRSTMYNSFGFGGLRMINILQFQDAFLLQWAEKLMNEQKENWKYIPLDSLRQVGGISIFKSNMNSKETKGLETICNKFWKRVVTTWLNLNANSQTDATVNINDPLFNNNKIQFKKQPLYLPSCLNRGIVMVKHIVNDHNDTVSFVEFQIRHGKYPKAIIDYNILKNAMKNVSIKRDTPQDNTLFRGSCIGGLKSKGFRLLLHKEEEPHTVMIWKRKYNVEIGADHWNVAIEATKETRLIILHWKILSNIYPTSILLQKMGIRESNKCPHCQLIDYTEHFFFECKMVKPLWSEIEKQIQVHCGQKMNLTAEKVLLGITEE